MDKDYTYETANFIFLVIWKYLTSCKPNSDKTFEEGIGTLNDKCHKYLICRNVTCIKCIVFNKAVLVSSAERFLCKFEYHKYNR